MTPPLGVQQMAQRLESVATGLTTLSRLRALALLDAVDTTAKLSSASLASIAIDGAAQIEEFLGRYFQQASRIVAWPQEWHPKRRRLLVRGKVDTRRLTDACAELEKQLAEEIDSFRNAVADDLCGSALEPLLTRISTFLPAVSSRHNGVMRSLVPAHRGPPSKTVVGPRHVRTDPVFQPSFSLVNQAIPLWTLSNDIAVPHFWTVCIKETLGAELCSLSMVEYDGLPLAFYRDMAKQAWDEMRHALLYLRVAIQLIPDLRANLDEHEPLALELTNFVRTGRGLPIPVERNLYEAIWNSTLAERLVLFQVDTEVPGSARKKKKQTTRALDDHPELARAIEFDLLDEQDHKRVGRTWLKYLMPDPAARREAIRNTRLLRGVLVLTAFAHYGHRDLGELITTFTQREQTTVRNATKA